MDIENVNEWLPWVWTTLAVLFSLAEIFTAGFVLICFGIGAGVAAALAFLGFGVVWQMAAFVIVSGAIVLYARQIAEHISNPNTYLVGIDRVVGKQGIVLDTIDPAHARGKVRIAHEEWSADSVDNVLIPAGVNVQVVAVDGVHLKVRATDQALNPQQSQ